MITKLVYLDEDNQQCALRSDEWIISRQSSDMGDFPCYVASRKDNTDDITISERIVVLVTERKDKVDYSVATP